MAKHRIYTTSLASVYPHYVTKAEKKGRTKAEVDEIIRWLTGNSQEELEAQLEQQTDFETFFAEAPQLNPSRALVKGMICGVRIEDIERVAVQRRADGGGFDVPSAHPAFIPSCASSRVSTATALSSALNCGPLHFTG